MPHHRDRHISEPFLHLLKFARILGVIGHRQTGKSTFVQANSSEYITLDIKENLERAKADSEKFIHSLKGKKSAIDECQLAPDLFPALKVKIGTSSIPGRFILSGSVRFSSRNAIRESLSGRIVNQELLPLVCTELAQESNSDFLIRISRSKSLRNVIQSTFTTNAIHRERTKIISLYSKSGGLPGICFVRNEQTRKSLLRDILETILDRDIRLIYPTTLPLEQIRGLCEIIARNPFNTLNYQEIKREIGLAPATTKRLVNALESVFLIRRIRLLGDQRGDLFWFEDQTERHFFTKDDSVTDLDWVMLLYRNLRAQYNYRIGEFAEVFQYKTRGGAIVPLVIKINNKWIGFFVVNSRNDISRSMIHSAESFIGKHEGACVLFVLKDENKSEMISDTIGMLPISSVLF